MSAIRLANRYAKSILQLSMEKGQLEVVMQDMLTLKRAISENRNFYLLLKSPIILADKKMKVINTAFKGQISEITRHFLEILARKGREAWLPEVIEVFIKLYNKENQITPVLLKTAYAVSDETRNAIINRLKSERNLVTVDLATEVDEKLIGGYILRYEDKMIDTSIERGLAILKDDFDNNEYIRKF